MALPADLRGRFPFIQVNCLSEVLFDAALRRASELDSYIAAHGKPIGPLHGLPVSVKDSFRVNGAETSVGFVGWLGKRETAETESEAVKMLTGMGAVVHVKTNMPTGAMVIATRLYFGLHENTLAVRVFAVLLMSTWAI